MTPTPVSLPSGSLVRASREGAVFRGRLERRERVAALLQVGRFRTIRFAAVSNFRTFSSRPRRRPRRRQHQALSDHRNDPFLERRMSDTEIDVETDQICRTNLKRRPKCDAPHRRKVSEPAKTFFRHFSGPAVGHF